jgi:hypothetical protein
MKDDPNLIFFKSKAIGSKGLLKMRLIDGDLTLRGPPLPGPL